jgi:hypothetical protein
MQVDFQFSELIPFLEENNIDLLHTVSEHTQPKELQIQ